MKQIWNQLFKNKKWFYIINTLLLILTCSNIYFLYNLYLLTGIETLLRIWIGIIIIIIWLICLLITFRVLIKRKKRILYTILILLYIGVISSAGIIISKVYSKIDVISSSNNTYNIHSTSIVTLVGNKANELSDIGDSKIGIVRDENSIEGYQMPQQLVKNKKLTNELIEYDNYITLLMELYEGNIDYIFLPTNYILMFNDIDGFKNIESETKIIYTYEQKFEKKIVTKKTSVKEPFTLLLMGVDSVKENIRDSSFNGDSLMLITFNPKTLNATILSIPRDSYVPIACFAGQRKNKITHAAWYGEQCMIKTIENFTGIDINYYVKINFKGVVKLVNALGGIEVNVPIEFCEQDSNRNIKNKICLKKGKQKLNGEQALALARYRKTINDIIRGQNQQLIVEGIMNKAKDIKSINTIYKLLDTISINMETNMSTNEILSFYNLGKDILLKSKNKNANEILGIQKLYLQVADKHIYDYNPIYKTGIKLSLYHAVLYQGSINAVVNAMKTNLGLVKSEPIKTFSFSIKEPYKEKIIGKGIYTGGTVVTLPNFVGKNMEEAINFGNKYDININVSYVTTADSNFQVGQISSQDIHDQTDIIYVKELNIKVVNQVITPSDPSTETVDCSLEENKEHPSCLLPNFVGKNISEFITWENKYKTYSIQIIKIEIAEDNSEYDATKAGQVIYQSKEAGTSIFDLLEDTLEIKYIKPITESSEDTENNETGDNNNEDESQEEISMNEEP